LSTVSSKPTPPDFFHPRNLTIPPFSTRTGTVEDVEGNRVAIRRASDGHRYSWKIRDGLTIFVRPGASVQDNQVIASTVAPVDDLDLACPGSLRAGHIQSLLISRERTQRFTGVKLARLRGEPDYEQLVEDIASDPEEDVYIRLEGLAYLASVCGKSARSLFAEPLAALDEQSQLEAVIAVGETSTPEAVELLSAILDEKSRPFFLRSAAAWCLGQTGDPAATDKLIALFSDVDVNLREEALDRIVALGQAAIPILVDRIGTSDTNIAAGCAEALRQQRHSIREILAGLQPKLQQPSSLTVWPTWLLGHLPREQVGPAIATLQDSAPQLHYAISVLWSFMESWIARRWELEPGASFHGFEEAQDV
jgi:HEAT repeats